MALDRGRRSGGGAGGGADEVGAPAPGKHTLTETLTSPRFAGDATLEACFEDRARLSVGARGAPVHKVQQALVDLGYDLGPSGADGDYGQATWHAVQQFKARERLGWESMGDVGPGTMHRLDALFPGGPREDAPERALEGGEPTASDFIMTTDEDLVGAPIPAAPDEAAIEAQMIAAPDAAAPVDAAAPRVHVPWDQAIKRFQSKVDIPGAPGAGVAESGQFFWGRKLGVSVWAELESLAMHPGAAEFAARARVAYNEVFNFRDGDAELAAARVAAAKAKVTPAVKARMGKLVHGYATGGAGVEAILWQALKQKDELPDLGRFRDLVTLRTVRKFDKVGCTVHVLQTAERLREKGGITGTGAARVPFARGLSNGAAIRNRAPVDDAEFPRHRGDVLTQTGVSEIAERMRVLLDQGQVLHARVLSGVQEGMDTIEAEPGAVDKNVTVPTAGEHSLLVIGWDDNKFVFHDPDPGGSKNPGGGFGFLYEADGHLSTAWKKSELRVDRFGDHVIGDHRYQVLSVSTV